MFPQRSTKSININNLLNETLESFLKCNLGHPTKSSAIPETPASDIFDSKQANNSATDVCLAFWAMAPIAWAAATLVSQFLLRRYCEIWGHQNRVSIKNNNLVKPYTTNTDAESVSCIEPLPKKRAKDNYRLWNQRMTLMTNSSPWLLAAAWHKKENARLNSLALSMRLTSRCLNHIF